jgi:hypothetical protein
VKVFLKGKPVEISGLGENLIEFNAKAGEEYVIK